MKKERYRVVQPGNRNGMFYCQDALTGSRTSLGTKARDAAERIVRHKHESLTNPDINRKNGMAYHPAA
jgi:hypothetical protein